VQTSRSPLLPAVPAAARIYESGAKYRFFFGGAAGPGKTKALLWEAIVQALRTPGCDTLLLRRTFPELESSLLNYFRRDVPKKCYRSYNEAKHIVTWWNGSTTRSATAENENDVSIISGRGVVVSSAGRADAFQLKHGSF